MVFAHRVEEVVQPGALEDVHVHQPPVNLHRYDVVGVGDGLEGGVHQRLVEVQHKRLFVHVLWRLGSDHGLAIHAGWLRGQLVQGVDQLQVGGAAARGPLGWGRDAAQQVPQAVAPAAAAAAGRWVLQLQLLLLWLLELNLQLVFGALLVLLARAGSLLVRGKAEGQATAEFAFSSPYSTHRLDPRRRGLCQMVHPSPSFRQRTTAVRIKPVRRAMGPDCC